MKDYISVEPLYFNAMIPTDYMQTYYHILAAIASADETAVKYDKQRCNESTTGIECFNLFQAMLAANRLNRSKLRDTIYKLIQETLNQKFNNIPIPKYVESKVKYIYFYIPAEYMGIYHKLLILLSNYGESMLKDCSAFCTDENINIIKLFNLFVTACNTKKNKLHNTADTIISYINESLINLYPNDDIDYVIYADDDLKLKMIISVKDTITFYIHKDDLDLYNEVFSGNVFPVVFPFNFNS